MEQIPGNQITLNYPVWRASQESCQLAERRKRLMSTRIASSKPIANLKLKTSRIIRTIGAT